MGLCFTAKNLVQILSVQSIAPLVVWGSPFSPGISATTLMQSLDAVSYLPLRCELLLMATRNPARKPVEGTVVYLPLFRTGCIHPMWCSRRISEPSTTYEWECETVRTVLVYNQLYYGACNELYEFTNHQLLSLPNWVCELYRGGGPNAVTNVEEIDLTHVK